MPMCFEYIQIRYVSGEKRGDLLKTKNNALFWQINDQICRQTKNAKNGGLPTDSYFSLILQGRNALFEVRFSTEKRLKITSKIVCLQTHQKNASPLGPKYGILTIVDKAERRL